MQLFLERFKKIENIWAIASSSTFWAEELVKLANISSHKTIVEVGPGDWIFTVEVLKELSDTQTFFTIEKDPVFHEHMVEEFPQVKTYNTCLSNIQACMKDSWVEHVDCLISSLPWSLFEEEFQELLLQSIYDALPEWWVMLNYTYVTSRVMSKGEAFKEKLETMFSRVEESDIIWLNLPPAFVYICHK